jgi:hypothetical protein
MKTINTYQRKGFVINQVRYDEATLGGHYAVEVMYNDMNILTMDGLTLDASNEAFLEEIKKLNRQVG